MKIRTYSFQEETNEEETSFSSINLSNGERGERVSLLEREMRKRERGRKNDGGKTKNELG